MRHLFLFCFFILNFFSLRSLHAFHHLLLENKLEIGGSIDSGNSPATTVNGKFSSELDLDPKCQRWGYEFLVQGKRATAQSIETARMLKSNVTSKHLFTNDLYTYAKIGVVYNAFETYDRVVSDSAGIGWVVVRSDIHKWTLEAGPGSSHQRISGSKRWQNQFVGHGESQYLRHISKNAEIVQTFQIDAGQYNTLMQSHSALKTNILADLALQLSFDVSHYTIIPMGSANTKKSDTSTNVSIVYNF